MTIFRTKRRLTLDGLEALRRREPSNLPAARANITLYLAPQGKKDTQETPADLLQQEKKWTKLLKGAERRSPELGAFVRGARESKPTPWNGLGPLLRAKVAGWVDPPDMARLEMASKPWNASVQHQSLWHEKYPHAMPHRAVADDWQEMVAEQAVLARRVGPKSPQDLVYLPEHPVRQDNVPLSRDLYSGARSVAAGTCKLLSEMFTIFGAVTIVALPVSAVVAPALAIRAGLAIRSQIESERRRVQAGLSPREELIVAWQSHKDPSSVEALGLLIQAMIAAKRWDEAIDSVRELGKRHPEAIYNRLWEFAACEHVPLLEAALEAGARIEGCSPGGVTALMCAAGHGNVAAIPFLIRRGASLHGSSERWYEVLDYALNGFGAGPHFDVVRALVEDGLDVNRMDASGRTALMHAAEHGDLPTVQFLIDHGAAVNARQASPWALDIDHGYGVTVNVRHAGRRPLDWALAGGSAAHLEVAECYARTARGHGK